MMTVSALLYCSSCCASCGISVKSFCLLELLLVLFNLKSSTLLVNTFQKLMDLVLKTKVKDGMNNFIPVSKFSLVLSQW